jgi:hypothetical protein
MSQQQTIYNAIAAAYKQGVISSNQFQSYVDEVIYGKPSKSTYQNISDPYNNGSHSYSPGCTYCSTAWFGSLK